MKKSQLVGFLLTLLFGPLGLLYSNVTAALGFLVAASVIGLLSYGLGAIVVWPITIIVGFFTVNRYNAKLEIEKKKH